MPGPVSDSYDPEFGTRETANEIIDALSDVYDRVSAVLENREPMSIRKLVRADLPTARQAGFSEKEWRLIRFALERAQESI
jgi:hypothetical protein